MSDGSDKTQFCPECGAGQAPGFSHCSRCCAELPNPYEPLNDDKIEHHLGFTIFTALLCCMPLGIVGVIFSAMSIADEKNGDLEEARRKARIAFLFSLWSMLVGALADVVYVLLKFVL